MPNLFPPVLSRDFRREEDAYEDFDNLFAMYLLDNMRKYSVRVNDQTQRLEIEKNKSPMAYPAAAELASRSAKADGENFRRRLPFRPRGTRIGEAADNTHRDTVVDEGNKDVP